jgi:hypothetical protein
VKAGVMLPVDLISKQMMVKEETHQMDGIFIVVEGNGNREGK